MSKISSVKKKVLKEILPKLFHRSRKLSSLYYALFDSSFSREHQAVLAGMVKHLEDANVSNNNYFMLVRNTHRLEKGLLMRPRRDVFGKEYIMETIDCFEGIWNSNDLSTNPQLKWFYDVLSEYFKYAQKDEFIKGLFERFQNITGQAGLKQTVSEVSIPYIRQFSESNQISYDAFFNLTRQRRSVRWFQNKVVPRELIDKAVLAANQAPSACNRQPFEFYIFDEPDKIKEIVHYPMGTKGYAHTIPVFIVIVGNLDAYFDERDRHIIYIDGSLAAMSLMLALETMGLSSCAINWPDIEAKERKMENFLKISPFQRPVMCLGVGYPDPEGLVAFSEKRPLSQIRKYNV